MSCPPGISVSTKRTSSTFCRCCNANTDCALGYHCDAVVGQCVRDCTTTPCRLFEQCDSVAHTCLPRCVSDADCPDVYNCMPQLFTTTKVCIFSLLTPGP
jgi:hypothetical protein